MLAYGVIVPSWYDRCAFMRSLDYAVAPQDLHLRLQEGCLHPESVAQARWRHHYDPGLQARAPACKVAGHDYPGRPPVSAGADPSGHGVRKASLSFELHAKAEGHARQLSK